MKERKFIHLILALTTSFGFYLILNPPYGWTWERIGGIFLVLFMSWATRMNFETTIKEQIKIGVEVK